MKVAEAYPILKAACNIPFKELFAGHPEDLTNKGRAGQLLLKYIGLNLDNALRDFEDGELKTNNTQPNGKPRETIAITQINRIIDTLVGKNRTPFVESNVYIKISNLLVVPVVKEDPNRTADWYFLNVAHIQPSVGSPLFEQLEADYNAICDKLVADIEGGKDGLIHTASGHYLQIRTKDSRDRTTKLYRPIYSQTYGRAISNKNHAFYFQKQFMLDVVAGKFD